ncbi:cytochrome c oxidase assembly protein [Ureibacillus sp. GCM10028918]|uniref:cytochrome c oxidase assembly protein n=1 Tax=Ureibacillus sp. GCM10028918 TaxID=3273429 RepID=UPI00361896EC
MHHHGAGIGVNSFLDLLSYALPIVFIVGYLVMVNRSNKKYKKWPGTRIAFWIMGVLAVSLAIVGPIAELAHTSFVAHMITHLLLGMLGPLLLVLAAPTTLLLRTVSVTSGRFLSKLLKNNYVQWVTHPVAASFLNAGGLWILYATDLYSLMHSSMWLFVLVHVHIFLAGYVFTLSIIYVEVTPHRTSFRLRAILLIMSMAAHGILSKWIYANPPAGIDAAEAQQGGMLMYYGGDAIEIVLVIILCYQYFSRNRRTTNGSSATVSIVKTTPEG